MIAALVQLIKDVEENLLCLLFSGQKLDVINDQYIDQLIKVGKITDGIILNGLNDLVGKFFGTDIQHRLVFALFDNSITDGLSEVRFSKTHISKDEQWIEGCTSGIVSNRFSGRISQAVAIPYDEVFKRIGGVELGVNLKPLNTGYDKGVANVIFSFIACRG